MVWQNVFGWLFWEREFLKNDDCVTLSSYNFRLAANVESIDISRAATGMEAQGAPVDRAEEKLQTDHRLLLRNVEPSLRSFRTATKDDSNVKGEER